MEAPETLATIDEQPSITFVARSLSNFGRFFYTRFRSMCNSSELSIIWLKTHHSVVLINNSMDRARVR